MRRNSRFLDPMNPLSFKKIFGAEEHKACWISFLNSIFKLQGEKLIQQVEFLNSFQATKIAGKKLSFIDVLCADQRGIHYVIEMQLLQTKGFEKRVQYYASKTYAAQANKGDDYPKRCFWLLPTMICFRTRNTINPHTSF